MLELIFQGFIEWFYGLTLECWQYFSSALLDIMSMDFAYLRTHMPVIDPIMQSMLAVGWALLIGNLVFQAAKTMLTGLGFEAEDPKLLFARTFVFSFLLLASPQICELCLNLTSRVIELMQVPDAVDITFADEASFGGLAAAWLLVVICGVIIMFQSFKLIFEMAERYFILAVLTITAPLAFSMGGSRSTSDIFSGWCRMYGSMCLLMIMHVVFIKMLLSVLSFYPSGFDVLPWMVLIFSVVKVAKKIDGIITRLGLNPAITGDTLGRMFPGALTYLVMQSAAAQITKTIGKNTGGHGRASHTPSGGPKGPKSGGPVGGRSAGPAPGAGRSSPGTDGGSTIHTEQDSRQSASQHTSAEDRQDAGVPPKMPQSGAYASERQADAASPDSGAAVTVGGQAAQTGSQPKQDRKTSVPPGTHRGPGYVRAAAGAAAGAAFIRAAGAGTAAPASGDHSAKAPGSQHTTPAPGKSGASRFTQVTSHRVQDGAASATVQSAGPHSVPAEGRHEDSRVRQPGTTPPPSVVSSGDHSPQGGSGAGADAGPTRSTRRPQSEAAPKGQVSKASPGGQPGTAGTTVSSPGAVPLKEEPRHGRNTAPTAPPASTERSRSSPVRQEPGIAPSAGSVSREGIRPQPGTAGTAAPSQSARPLKEEPRRGRNVAPAVHSVSTERSGSSPVRQEPRIAPGAGTAPRERIRSQPGTAGTAPGGRQAPQTRQTAGGQPIRGSSPLMGTESRRAAPASRDKGLKGPERKAASRPPRQDGGAKHGKP